MKEYHHGFKIPLPPLDPEFIKWVKALKNERAREIHKIIKEEQNDKIERAKS